jgi:hypothetical protein
VAVNGRELLKLALHPGVLMHAAAPGAVIQSASAISCDGSEMRSRLVEGIAATPSGAELIRRADAEPVLRGALDKVPSRVWSHVYHEFRRAGVDEQSAMARADLVRIETERTIEALRTIAALTTLDAPG